MFTEFSSYGFLIGKRKKKVLSKIELYEAITSAHDTFTTQVTIPSSGTVVMADDNYSVGPCQTGWDSTSLEGGCIVLLSVMLRDMQGWWDSSKRG